MRKKICESLLVIGVLVLCGGSVIAAKPDIAIFVTDQQQADAMGVAGTADLKTPTMDGLAREGVRFTRAFCATPQCSPARGALWTGRYPHRTGVMGNVCHRLMPPAGMSRPLDGKIPNIAHAFAAAGYETVYFGKWHLGHVPCEYGFETCSREGLAGDELTRKSVAFLKARATSGQKRRPLLMIVSWLNPHDIYQVESPEVKIDRSRLVKLPANFPDDLGTRPFPQSHFMTDDQGKPFQTYTPQQWKDYIRFYHHLVERVDGQIGQVLAEFRRQMPDSLVVFGSDHGDSAGAHGMPYKSPSMYEELVRVPLVVSWPGHIRAGVSDGLVSQIDLLPTLCDLAGVPGPEGMDGRSLGPLLKNPSRVPADWREAVYVEYFGKQNWRVPIRMVRTRSQKYVRYLAYGEEFYDLQADPHEMKNLAGQPGHVDRNWELARHMDAFMEQTADPFAELTVTDLKGKSLSAEQVAQQVPATRPD